MSRLSVLFCLLLFQPLVAQAEESVTLQLKWEHEFQFAGYYAAKWQGYYREAGLNVDIRSAVKADGSLLSSVEQVRSNHAEFGIGSVDILIAQDKGHSLKALMPVFQRSPVGIFTLTDNPANNLKSLAKQRIAVAMGSPSEIEVRAVFNKNGLNPEKIEFVDISPTVEVLLSGKADAIATYEISAKVQARENSVILKPFYPANYGVNFYGDTLFTSERLITTNPELVSKFVAASKKGWRYALENRKAIAERITKELTRQSIHYQNIFEYNHSFAKEIDSMLRYPEVPLGTSNPTRWQEMNKQLISLGLVNSPLQYSKFYFDTQTSYDVDKTHLLIVISLFALIPITFILWYRRNLVLTCLVLTLTVCLVDFQVEKILWQKETQDSKLKLLRLLGSISAKLEATMQINLSMITSFANYISANPDITQNEFERYAKTLYRQEPLLINIAAAKDMQVNLVYPIRGNEEVLGLNYKTHPAQREMALRVIQENKTLVAGPVNLVQGGIGFIGRAPIYYEEAGKIKPWGIISAPIDALALYRRANIDINSRDINIALKSVDSKGQHKKVFYGNAEIFNDPEKIQLTIKVGDGSWILAGRPNTLSTNNSLHTELLITRAITILTGLLLCVFAIFRFKIDRDKKEMESRIQEGQTLLEKVGRVAKIGGWKLDKNLNFVQWSEQSSLILEASADFSPGTLDEIRNFFNSNDFELLKGAIISSLKEPKKFEFEFKLILEEQSQVWVRIIGASHEDNQKTLITGTFQDVTNKVMSAKIIERQATYDALTDLPNRVLFNDRLNKAIEDAIRHQSQIGVLFIDLDRFKPINDNYGHATGDRLLVHIAKVIKNCVRDSDTVSRISGDEFAVILPDIKTYKNIVKLVENILEKIQQPIVLNSKSLHCSASIGISLFPDDARDAQSLISKADQAMYEVKSSGRNSWQFYTKEMQIKSEYRHNLLNELHKALDEKQLKPFFQPIVCLNSGKVAKLEVLARWRKTDGSFVPPIEFISLAEESGLINRIDLEMLTTSAEILSGYCNDRTPVELSINVSPRLFHTKDKALNRWLDALKTVTKQIKVTVEITERLLTEDTDKATRVLNKLQKQGVKIAIDDFGTGYSSLSYLIRFPVNIIKIDREFVDKINIDDSSNTLIKTILAMAKKLKIQVVAEGIETSEQLEFLKKAECDFGQGYFLFKPVSCSDLDKVLRRSNKNEFTTS
ncbi:EAL domain-containing protein [Aliikangiella sp. G2MR2-5]|uniref:EAL domain-containing protein n=1 Tax=Aliikangiella sp. G2MR2-5 TaxID=2788943 RepID=UPI0018AB1FCA|nr:EAL domain-containing protein [Aliikangiella sp. G2MR2-5]